MSIKWLFFDLGGTVYDETLSDMERIDELIIKNSLDISYDDFYCQMKKAAQMYEESPFSAARAELGSSVLNVPYSNKKERLYPDAAKIIQNLSEKYKLGILANQPPNTRERLACDGLLDFFDICLLSDCEHLYKPDLRFFEYALDKVGCHPYETVMIGDRLDNDVFPAKKAGMKTVRIVQGLFSVQKPLSDEYRPDVEIYSLSELLDIEF